MLGPTLPIMIILASTARPPNQCPCTLSPMQYLFQRRDALSVQLEDPKRQFVLSFAHPARVCSAEKWGTRAHVPPLFFMHWAVKFVPCPPEESIPPTGSPPIKPASLRGWAKVITKAGRRQSLLQLRWTGGRRQSLLESRKDGGETKQPCYTTTNQIWQWQWK